MTPPMPSLRQAVARVGRLARKELSESLRDRRTVLTLILMPLLLYPLLALGFQQMLLSGKVEKMGPVYRIGVVNPEEGRSLFAYWSSGVHLVVRRYTQPGEKVAATEEDIRMPAHHTPFPRTRVLPLEALKELGAEDLDDALRRGLIDVVVRVSPPGPLGLDVARASQAGVELRYREDSAVGRDAARTLEAWTAEANSRFLVARLKVRGIAQPLDPVRFHVTAVPDPEPRGKSLFPVLVPLVLVLMTMTGAVYPAIDLTAGERERGTLEVLVAAPVSRLSLLLAKYVAVLAVATLTALINLGTMVTTLWATGIGQAVFQEGLTPLTVVQVLALLLLLAGFFSAVLLCLTSFARSFKEAQAYIVPLMLLALAPGMAALLPGLSLNGPLAVAPLMNVVLLARDLLEGSARPASAAVVVATTLLYALAALAVAARVFGTEAVLSSEQATWGDLFRRPARPQPTATPSGALLCLALMFPANFLLSAGLARTGELPAGGRLALMAAANLALFGAVPLISAWLGRARLGSAFRLRAPSGAAVAVAALLGVSLWPFAHELILLLRQAGFTTLREEHLEKVREALAAWRALRPAALLLALAVLPAVLEELFFRGYLFSALDGQGESPRAAILGTAGLFALFHLLVTDALAVERVPPSLLLGLVLGWLAWKSGSVLPGMLLHCLHNGTIVLMGYYEPRLKELGWVPSAEDHLPGWLLASAAGLAALGLLAVWRMRDRDERANKTI